MQDRELLMRALETAKQKGASYADVRLNRYLRQSISTREKRVTGVSNDESFGFGIKLATYYAEFTRARRRMASFHSARLRARIMRRNCSPPR